MLNKTDAWSWDHLYTKFERYLDIWSLNYHYHKIIILAQFKYWCKHPLRNYPSITKRQKYASCFWTCNSSAILELFSTQASHGQKDFLTQSSVRSFLFMMEEVCLFPLFFFYLSFIMAIEWTITVHTGRRTDEWLEGKKKDRLIAD